MSGGKAVQPACISYDPATLDWAGQSKLINGAVIPRPVALVSTTGPHGGNVAPFSFFNAVSVDPCMVMFSVGPYLGARTGERKDTLVNIEATGEFVAHIVNVANCEKMTQTSAEHPYGFDEATDAGFITAPSVKIRPLRLIECPVQMECRLFDIRPLGRNYHMIIGEVVQFHLHEGIANERLHLDSLVIDPVARLAGGGSYSRIAPLSEKHGG